MTPAMDLWRLAGGIGLAAAAAIVSAILIVMLRPWLERHALARPNARSAHRTPTPQGGGIAVVAATLGVSLAAMAAGAVGSEAGTHLWSLFAATALIALVGAIDDILTLDIAPRLLLQTIAVTAVIIALPGDLRIVPVLPLSLERVLLVLAGIWFVNLVNFMDGIDWITVAEVVPINAGLLLIGLLTGGLPAEAMAVSLALCGAVLGFAPFNRPVARLFLGDVGSLPIGLLLLWLLTLLAGSGHLVAAIILPLYYLADATITLLRRMLNGEPFWQAHRTHFYQRATDRGFTVPEVVARVFIVNLGLVVLALSSVLVPGMATALTSLAAAAALVAWLLLTLARGKQ
ncbi:MAG TPA: glycosyltransferase family 4 protein [Xanthobacteraceae bacterium]|nr:glycosyltransferase family 4 protein [Xanthobacteraceae bacterium]